jgi:putative transcriptional regulator
MSMEKKLFNELLQSVREMRAVRRGELAPSHVWKVKRGPGAKLVRRQLDSESSRRARRAEWDNNSAKTRARLGLSQSKFAELLGISIKTLHNWGQGRRKPTGAARVLLRVASLHPEAVLEAAAA